MWHARSVTRVSWLVATVAALAVAVTIVATRHARPEASRIDAERARVDRLETLANLYASQGKSDQAIRGYQELMKTSPTDGHVCVWQSNIARVRLSMGGSTSDAVAEIEHLVRISTAPHDIWMYAADRKACRDLAAVMSGELARAYHSEAATTKNPETLSYAERLYEAYLDGFPDAADFAQTQYYYAELLWTRAEAGTDPQQWARAASAFTDVVKTHGVDAKLMRESAYAAVLGWKNVVSSPDQPSSPASTAVVAMPPATQKLIAAMDAFIAVVDNPNDDDVIGVKFIEANTYRRYNQFDVAIPMFEDILAHHPEHETAEYSASLLAEMSKLRAHVR